MKWISYSLAAWLLAALAVLISVVQWLCGVEIVGKMLHADDGPFAISTLMQFREELANGILMPKWSFSGNFGMGSPIFFFYPLGTYYLASVIGLFLPGMPESFLIGATGVVLIVFSIATCVLWLIRYLKLPDAVTAGAIYCLMPYVALINPQRRLAFAEMAAAPLWPLAFLAVDRGEGRIVKTAIYVAPIVAIFGLVHVPSWILCVGLLPIYAVFKGGGGNLLTRRLTGVVAGMAMGIGIAAFHLAPAYALQSVIPVGNLTNYGFTSDLLWRNSLSTGIGKVRDFCLLLPLCAAVFLTLAVRTRTAINWAILLTLCAASLLTTPLMQWLWTTLPPLRRVQFQWRLLGPISLLGAAMIGFSLPKLGTNSRRGVLAVVGCIGIITAAVSFHFSGHGSSARVRTQQAVDSPFSQTPEYFPAPPADGAWRALQLSGAQPQQRVATLESSCLGRSPQKFRRGNTLTIPAGACIGETRLPVFYFPGWSATVGGASVPLTADRLTGLVDVDLPRLGTDVLLTRTELSVNNISLQVSLICVLTWLFSLIVVSRAQVRAKKRLTS